jgi:pimeloyl-ACP methyl ester carboxylesterase
MAIFRFNKMVENLLSKFHQWFGIPYRLHVQSNGSGPVIILLHGIATSSKSWNHLIPYLKNDHRVITIDLLGFGLSPKPNWYAYTPEEHVKNIHYTIKKLKINEPFILIGHSMGSLLALHYANKHPKNIRHLYLLSPPIYLSKKDAQKARKVWRDTLYARAYKYIRLHKNFTLKGARGLKFLALKNNPFSITEETWLSFSKSLEECIEKQDVVKDLEQLNYSLDVFYGRLDNLLIKKNIHQVFEPSKANLHITRGSHLISDKYARSVAGLITSKD